ncbi:MAG: di-trans,poly-cis-decaprenylcistransferase, partial [Romboutsia sp.]|nr:di-trans,poly-cis-decaprenylcistransferase [Romboutsia sp.]
MFNFFKASKNNEELNIELDEKNIPQHVAIIMDGNGRWAKQRNMPRTMGHKAGVETIRRIVKEADRLGIKFITLYAFSTENWKRPKDEVNALMKLLVQYLKSEVGELHKNGVILRVLGDISQLQEECRKEIEDSIELTKNNTGLVLNVAFNYGGRAEIISACNSLICEGVKEVNEKDISSHLYTSHCPDPDLIVRTASEYRLSNFL